MRLLVTLPLLMVSCTLPEPTVVAPPPADVRDVTLLVLPANDSSDTAVADALGWAGGLPGVTLTLRPLEGEVEARTLLTDSTGRANVQDVAIGVYRVEGRRLLSDAERAGLTPGTDAEAFVGEVNVAVAPTGDAMLTVRLPLSVRGGLVLSEWAFKSAYSPSLGSYPFSGFVELVNNGTATIYLDGMILAQALSYAGHSPGALQSCEDAAWATNDPSGVWTSFLVAFPGNGSEYPVAPGGVVVVAMDAIDHRGLWPEMLDLREANFELAGGPDNPAVPDMRDLSIRRNPIHEHGPWFDFTGHGTAVLARPGDVQAYERRTTSFEHLRLPGSSVVDALTAISTRAFDHPTPGWIRCPRFVHRNFDREYGVLLREGLDEYTVSMSRKVLYVNHEGRSVLQNTRSSAIDWQRTPRSPGFVNP